MRFILTCALLSAVVRATFQSTSIKETTANTDNINIKNVILLIEERSIKDIWNTIKDSARNIWKSVKEIGDNSEQKVKIWIRNLKNHLNEIKTMFDTRLDILKGNIIKLMREIVKTSHVVQSCVKENEKSISDTANHIVNHVTSCISGNVTKLSQFESGQLETSPLNEDILREIEEELNDCVEEKDVESCSYDAQIKIFDQANNKMREIFRNHEYIRSSLDDLLDAIITCSVEGIIHASVNITSEAVKIIECVVIE